MALFDGHVRSLCSMVVAGYSSGNSTSMWYMYYHLPVCMCMYVCMYVFMYIYMHVCMYVHVYIYACMYV